MGFTYFYGVDVIASLKKYSFLVMHINISARKNLYHK